MPMAWTIGINWDRDGDFTDSFDDVTSRTLHLEWALGMRTLYEDTASDSRLQLVLDNTDKRYSLENTSSLIAGKVRPFVPVRVQSNDGTVTRTHWVGWIETIQPDVGLALPCSTCPITSPFAHGKLYHYILGLYT